MTEQPTGDQVQEDPAPWPNRSEVVDGVVPCDQVPQDPDLFLDDATDES